MEEVKFSDIPILQWGNDIHLKGMLMEDGKGLSYIVPLPMEKVKSGTVIVMPDSDEWYALQDQLDRCNILSSEGVLLRKGQRILDQKICWQVYRRDKYACRYCAIDNVPLTVDHIITWESGGATHVDNLLTACKKCNKARGNIDYGSWLQHKYYITKSQFLSEEIRRKNEEIVHRLSTLPLVAKLRDR